MADFLAHQQVSRMSLHDSFNVTGPVSLIVGTLECLIDAPMVLDLSTNWDLIFRGICPLCRRISRFGGLDVSLHARLAVHFCTAIRIQSESGRNHHGSKSADTTDDQSARALEHRVNQT